VDQRLVFATALIVPSTLSRAIGSFFLGLSRPPGPTKLFESYEAALPWLGEQRSARGQA
jgi:hypothetical protein